MARLLIATPEGPQTIALRPINSLGRHPNNTIQLLDKIVSKEHCIMEFRDGSWLLRDLGSLNGTFINGERVNHEQALHHGDEIALGATRLRFDESPALPEQSLMHRYPNPISQPLTPPVSIPTSPSTHSEGQSKSPANTPLEDVNLIVQPWPNATFASAQEKLSSLFHNSTPSVIAQPDPSTLQPPYRPGTQRPSNAARLTKFVELPDANRAIGAQIAAVQKGFASFEQIAQDPQTIRDDYERLRIAYEVTRELAGERDTDVVLSKILDACFKFVRADRGVIFLLEGEQFIPQCNRRRSGGETPVVVSTTILEHVKNSRSAVLTNDAALDFASSKGKSMILNRISSAMVVPLIHNDRLLGILWLDSEQLSVFLQKELELVTALAYQAAMFLENTLLAKQVAAEILMRDRLSRLLSPNLAQQVLSGKLDVKLGGDQLSECTVFNSDIRGFTTMSEGTAPHILVEMLNEYFERMVEVLFKYEGTLDKFMGDGIMALFGAPVAHSDDPIRAVYTALEMMDVLGGLNRERLARNEPPLAIGIGIHTGPLVAGYVGSSKALSYTVIGDTANISARLCGIAEAGQILVTETTMIHLQDRFELAELPPVKLKGKEQLLRIYNVQRLLHID